MFYSHTHHYCCNGGFVVHYYGMCGGDPRLCWATKPSGKVSAAVQVINTLLSYRRVVDLEDELSDIPSDSVPSEVRNWLASTFTRQKGLAERWNEDKLRFRSIVHVVQAGIFVDRSASSHLHPVK